MRKYYPGITLFKTIGAVVILCSHVRIPFFRTDIGHTTAFDKALYIVVPCFYIISGFLAYYGWSNASNPKAYVKKYLSWISSLYLLAFVLFVITIVLPSADNVTAAARILYRRSPYLTRVLFIYGPFINLWFIPPVIFSTIFCYYFERRQLLLLAGIIAGLLLLLSHVVSGSLTAILGPQLANAKIFTIQVNKFIYNYFGKSLFFVLSGVVIAKHQQRFTKINGLKISAAVIAFTFIECLLLNRLTRGAYPYVQVLSVVPLSLWLFYGLLRVKSEWIKKHHHVLNMFSMTMFFTHYIFFKLDLYLLNWNFLELTTSQSVMCFGLILLQVCIITALFILFRKPKNTAGIKFA